MSSETHTKASAIVLAAGGIAGVFLHEVGEWPELRLLLAGGADVIQRNPFPFLPTLLVCMAAYSALWLLLSVAARRRRAVELSAALRQLAPAFAPAFALLSVFLIYASAQAVILISLLLVLVPSTTVALLIHLFPSATGLSKRNPPSASACAVALALLIAAYVVAFFELGLAQLRTFSVPFTDAGVFERMMWNTLRGNILRADERVHVFLGTRVRFFHFFLLPLYALRPRLETLMFLQTTAIACGAIPLYLLARRTLKNARAALFLAAAYLLHPATEFLNIDVTGEVFRFGNSAPTFAMCAVYLAWRRRWRWAVVFAALALSCREEYALLLAAFGTHLMLFGGQRRAGSVCVIVGSAWFVLSIWVVIPYFRGEPFGGLAYYTEAARQTAGLDWGRRVWFLCALLAPFGFLPLANVRVAWMALPALAICLACRKPHVYSIQWHYHGAVMPFLILAVPGAIATLQRRLSARRALTAAVGYVFVCAAVSNVFFSRSPLSTGYRNRVPTYRQIPPRPAELRLAALREAQALIPRSSSVCASEFTATHFTHYGEIHVYPHNAEACDYVVGSEFERWQGTGGHRAEDLARELRRPIVFQSHGLFVLGDQ